MQILRSVSLLLAFTLLLGFYSCRQTEHRFQKTDISSIKKEAVHIHRYGKELFSTDSKNLKTEIVNLNPEYHFFLGDTPDAENNIQQLQEYLQDTILINLYKSVSEKYSDITKIEKDLSKGFRYYRYHFPKKNIPKIYSFISGIDFRYPIQYYDSVMIISLDMYLGEDFEPYTQLRIPKYRSCDFTPEQIVPDCFLEIGDITVPSTQSQTTFLDKILRKGKVLYFADAMLPTTPDSLKIKYSTKQIKWCNNNEKLIWTYLIENDLLFSTDYSLTRKLLSDGPFTSDFGTNSAPRIGEWVGWQIIRSYMNKNPEIKLQQLIHNANSHDILKGSGYKP
ncbi:MAG: hypothetical protein U9R32_08850 [Bacteroidota bacterium]|nr:hypothetical protein [Bacteroidota bacterium]